MRFPGVIVWSNLIITTPPWLPVRLRLALEDRWERKRRLYWPVLPSVRIWPVFSTWTTRWWPWWSGVGQPGLSPEFSKLRLPVSYLPWRYWCWIWRWLPWCLWWLLPFHLTLLYIFWWAKGWSSNSPYTNILPWLMCRIILFWGYCVDWFLYILSGRISRNLLPG